MARLRAVVIVGILATVVGCGGSAEPKSCSELADEIVGFWENYEEPAMDLLVNVTNDFYFVVGEMQKEPGFTDRSDALRDAAIDLGCSDHDLELLLESRSLPFRAAEQVPFPWDWRR